MLTTARGCRRTSFPTCLNSSGGGDQARSSRGGEGSGLGLYIVKHIVEAHGGSIQARNDHGLVFEIALLCAEVE